MRQAIRADASEKVSGPCAISARHALASSGSFRAQRPLIGVLAVQGAFVEHERILEQLGARCIELRSRSDLDQDLQGVVLPGGESTAQGKLLRELGMMRPLHRLIEEGMPVLATCAGMILLATDIAQGDGPHLATLPMRVRRNAYGRQLDSFRTTAEFDGMGPVPMTFIRAPLVEEVGSGTRVLARVKGRIIAVRHGYQTALAFHPELEARSPVHEAWLREIAER